MFSTVGTAGAVDPRDIGKVTFVESTVVLGGDAGGAVVASKIEEQVSATIRYPISPADMPQVQVEDLMLHINYRLGSTTGSGAATKFPHVVAELWEVAYLLHSGVPSEAKLFTFDSLGDINGQDYPNQFVTSTSTISPTGTPQATHVCDSSKNAYYIALTLSGPPQPLATESWLAPAVSAIWLTIT
jgi:hypothetical protein